MATLGLTPAEKEAVDGFRRDVVEPSMTSLVMIDFWAEWCGPCKALTPILEKVATDYAGKGVILAKVDVDANQFIANQFQVRSIPTVYAMFQGQLVADLSSARTESQLRTMLDQLLRQLPVQSTEAQAEAELEPLIEMGEQSLAENDPERALSIFEQIAELVPEHPVVAAGRARALLALGRAEEAESVLAALPEDAKGAEIEQARAAIALAKEAQPVEDLSGLAAQAATGDMEARYELAGGQMASGDRDGAAETLLAMVRDDREWNEGAARQRLLKLFEAVGLEDPWVSAQRRKLSAILFG
ncbi:MULTISPECIES: tetratricopeptide repeat protein [Sphingomonas]|uniref:Putative thioredoxin n=1 Tax=Sphingomonas kyeonggiensis TaxID=1268553 RepID=A0A7W7NRN4_9SPHN|nr:MULTISPECIES: tetratricopeptide repeat protein [Sphingomonas]MBB4837992.1 putative thioredoxin [Sphingomonas kyeonggiensis]WHU01545.1 tetratricopeptide repeat protein [Sphingomonas sp. NIBR02145]